MYLILSFLSDNCFTNRHFFCFILSYFYYLGTQLHRGEEIEAKYYGCGE